MQLRDKGADEREIVRAGRVFRRLCDAYDALFLVNDHPALAVACAADGVHLGQDDAPPAEVRRMVGDDALIGLSTHTSAEIDAASGVDYIAVGPVHATPTKAGRPAIGTGPVTYASAHVSVPWFAIGGIDPDTVGAVVKAGARRIVVVRAIAEADDPEAVARKLRAATNGARRG